MEINLRADQEAHLKQLCAEMGRTVDDFAGEAILTFMEDYEDGRDAQAALAEGGPTFTQEEMEQEFGLDNRVFEHHQKDSLESSTRRSGIAIVRFMRERVIEPGDPYILGDALTGQWAGHWRYRVGDYRIICEMRNAKLLVMVVKVGHRSDVYER